MPGTWGLTGFTHPEDAHPVLPARNHVLREGVLTGDVSSRNIELLHVVKDHLGEVAVVQEDGGRGRLV